MNHIKTTTLLSFLTLLIFSCQNEGSNYPEKVIEERPLTEEELKEQLHDTECKGGGEYIEGTLEYAPIYKNLLSLKVTGLKLTLNLSNHATLAIFKDIDIRISFMSKTGATIFEENITVYEFIKPGKSIVDKREISCTNQQYNDIAEVSWTVTDAACN